jgi:hypothetical protein
MQNCEHKELELKEYQTDNGKIGWYECKKCHKMFQVKDIQAL